jgi:hypothetical protein
MPIWSRSKDLLQLQIEAELSRLRTVPRPDDLYPIDWPRHRIEARRRRHRTLRAGPQLRKFTACLDRRTLARVGQRESLRTPSLRRMAETWVLMVASLR